MYLDNWDLQENVWGNVDDTEVKDVISTIKSMFENIFSYDYVNRMKVKIFRGQTYNFCCWDNSGIYLNYDLEERKWECLIYGFSHELCHYIISTTPEFHKRFGWFIESFCHMASFFFLNSIYNLWTNNSYDGSRLESAQIVKGNLDYWFEHRPNYNQRDFLDFYRKNKEKMETGSENRLHRDEYDIVGIQFFKIAQKAPQCLNAIKYIQTIEFDDSTTFDEIINRWYLRTPQEYKPFVVDVASLFSIGINGPI